MKTENKKSKKKPVPLYDRRINVPMTNKLFVQFTARCARDKRSKSDVIRELMERHLKPDNPA